MPFPPTAQNSSCSVKDNIIPHPAHIYTTTHTHPVQREMSAGTGVYESILIITIKPTFPEWNRPLTKKQAKKAPQGWYTSSQHPVGFIILPKERCWSVKPTQTKSAPLFIESDTSEFLLTSHFRASFATRYILLVVPLETNYLKFSD